MKQSTSFAQVATNLLKVLQGYTKGIRFLLVMFLTLMMSVEVWAETITDQITASDLKATSTTYTAFSNVSKSSDAIYAGQSAKDNSGNIQLRSKNSNSGIVSTTSGGKVKSVKITVGSGSNAVDVYGSNTAYTAATDLYDTKKQGTKIGSVTSTNTITFTEDYTYVGIRSSSGAIYLSRIDIVWETAPAAPSFTITATSNNDSYGAVSVSGTTITATPKTGYRVSTSNPYEVTEGTATVVDNGDNTFTVTPESNCTVQINFEAIPTHNIHFNTGGLTTIASVDVLESETYSITQDPSSSLTQECEYNTFVGWTESNTIANPSSKPTTVNSIKMGSSDITLYAVYSKTEGGGGSAAEQGTTMFSENWEGCTNNTQPAQPTKSGSAVYNDADIDYVWYTPSGGSKTQTYTSGGPNSNENILISKNNGYWKVVGIPTGQAETLTLSSSKSGSGVLSISTSTSNVSISGSTITIGSSNVYTFDLIFTNTNSSSNLRLDDISVVVAKAGATGTTTYSLTPNCTTTQTANYTVNHYQQNITDDNYTLKETEKPSGEVGTSVTPDVKTYTGFKAPSTLTVTIKADGKTVVEYYYTRNSYTLTWNLDGGTISTQGTAAGEVKYGAALTAPTVTKTDYTFAGWSPAVAATMPAANTTYTAQWKKKHTIKWIVNGDTDTPYETTYVVDGDALALPSNPNAPSTCEDKVFVGWTESATVNADGNGIEYVDENTKPNTDKTYYAVFASLDGDAAGDYKRVTSELSDWSGEYLIVYETSETTGVAFDGSGSTDDQIDKTNNNVSVTINNNTIQATDDLNNRTFIIEKMFPNDCSDFDYYDYYSIRTKGGAYIGRESDSSNGLDIYNTPYPQQIYWIEVENLTNGKEETIIYSVINCDPSEAILLFNVRDDEKRFRYFNSYQEPIALYRKSSYTDYTTVCVETYNVTYDANGATSGNVPVDENNYISGDIVTVLGNIENLQKTHYSFVKWNTQADGNGTFYQAGETFTITKDVTLYAIWEELPQYSVTWYVNGKQLTDVELNGASTTVYKGDRITNTPPAPNPEDFCGQVFVGWTDAEMDVNDTNKPTIYNLVDEFPITSGDQTFYAVFADYKD